jgi:ABC-type polysaccharide/polyol phosphate transport system ATPase subunit
MSDALPAVLLDGVAKSFRARGKPRSVYRALADWLGGGAAAGALPALDGLCFAVAPGERVGVVGDNGSGKTTLLRTIAGLYRPSAGRIEVRGDVALVTGLGIGMLDELSVEENIFLYGAINGMSREELTARLPEIIEWAELGAFRTARLKTLSTGMRSRLAFSAVRHVDAAIYLMDEVLSAGDRNFKIKCATVFEGFKASGRTFVVASHELNFVQGFCDKVLWLHKGRQMAYGEPGPVVEQYVAFRRG